MKNKKTNLPTLACIAGLFILIFDSKTAVIGATTGIEICLKTVIPSLFPYIFLTTLLLPTIGQIKLLRPLGNICGIPTGAEHILLIGVLGGYPVGAKIITLAWKHELLSTKQAKRLLGFCSNSGPSFLFGMGAVLFENKECLWIIWMIHILSAIIVGILLPDKERKAAQIELTRPSTAVTALNSSLRSIASICGWVVLFKIILTFLDKWFLKNICATTRSILVGLIELSNGFVDCNSIIPAGLRMIVLSTILGFGGLCVLFQTLSVTEELGIGYYFPGKILQGLISFLISYVIQLFIFPTTQRIFISSVYIIIAFTLIIFVLFFLFRKKIVAIIDEILYNVRRKSKTGERLCYFVKSFPALVRTVNSAQK